MGEKDATRGAPETTAADLAVRLRRARARVERRIAAIDRDLSRVVDAEGWAARASWLVPLAARAKAGATALRGVDWSTGEGVEVSFPLDPARPPRAQVERAFSEARRLRRGVAVAEGRRREAEATCATIDAIAAELEETGDVAAAEDRFAAAEPDARWAIAAAGKQRLPAASARERKPYRVFLSGGARIWVGRGAKDNDELTTKIARPHHLFLHARGHAGAHVIVATDAGSDVPPPLFFDAAHLAAHFSDARGEAFVEVSHAERRYVRKPRKSPPGLVVIDREKIVSLRVDPSRIARLLAAEVPA